ncbi:MAG TPA: hypothetical protein VFH99_03615 [Candidatus Saccharimonadales bacterium]|nr:hypothetical protein [Candidatus Saccharimonadales bacterium]
MNLLYSIFFGAGVAAVAYTRLGRRAGYGNTQNVWLITGVVFVIATVIFLTVFSFLPHSGK